VADQSVPGGLQQREPHLRLYSTRVAESYQTVWAPAASKDVLWVPTTTTLWGFQGPNGRDAGHTKLDFAPTSGAATNGSEVFMADAKGWLQAVVTSNTFVDWNYWVGGPVTAGAVINEGVTRAIHDSESEPADYNMNVQGPDVKGWQGVDWGRFTDEPITARPVLDNSLVYFAGHDGVVYASLQSRRNVLWEFKTEGPCVADLTRTKNNLILVPSLDYTLYAFAAGGRTAWRYNAGEPLNKKAFTAGNQVFLLSDEAGLTVLDTAAGKKQWTLQQAANFVSSGPQTVYLISRRHELMAVNRADGTVKWSLPLPPHIMYAPNEADNGILYLITPAGKLEAIGRKGASQELPPPGARITAGPETKPIAPPPAAPKAAAGADAGTAVPAVPAAPAAPAAPTAAAK
jgi:outer membrane protein assembly factor BamB